MHNKIYKIGKKIKKIIFHLYYKSKNKWKIQFYNHTNTLKLHIGCGENIIPWWLNTDIKCRKNVVYLDAGKRFPFRDCTFDYIFSEHVFEHLDFEAERNMLNESFRVLKNEGILRLSTPNLDFLKNLYEDPENDNNKKYIEWAWKRFIPKIYTSFSKRTSLNVFVINNFFRDWGHQIIHNYSSLNEMLLDAGFKKTKRVEMWESISQELKNLERHSSCIGESFNRMESMIVEAIKI